MLAFILYINFPALLESDSFEISGFFLFTPITITLVLGYIYQMYLKFRGKDGKA